MTKKTKEVAVAVDGLVSEVREFLELNTQAGIIKKKMDALKESITAHGNSRYAEFIDGELVLESGKLKVALNPPKMVFEQNGKTVEPPQRAHLALLLPEAYRTVDLNVKLIQDRLNADKILFQGLKGQGITVKQETRYDIKPLK